MPEDHLSNETSVSFELTETGVRGSAKSRAVAAVDRLVGSVADIGAAWFESITTRQRAKTEGERRIIEAAAQYGIDRMAADPEFAERAFGNQFKKFVTQQVNKDAVVQEALQDLRAQPPTDEEAQAGPEQLSEQFMDRFEAYSAFASTEELRQRWGRVLASEIRAPGRFSVRCLRVLDEIELQTAEIFERLCALRLMHSIPVFLTEGFNFDELKCVRDAGLLSNESHLLAPTQRFTRVTAGGAVYWFMLVWDCGLAIPEAGEAISKLTQKKILLQGPALRVFTLTDAGAAISSVTPSTNEERVRSLISHLSAAAESDEIRFYRRNGENWTPER